MNLCAYKDIFGKEKEGAHQYRVFNIAIVDLVLTVAGAYLIARYFELSFPPTLLFLILLSILFHYLFCVNSTLTVFVFGIHEIHERK